MRGAKKGDTDKEIADYSRIIDQLPGTPDEQVARALANRGWHHYEGGMYAAFVSDTEAALEKMPTLDYVAFNLGLALLACERDAEALAAYCRAMEQFPTEGEKLGLDDLLDAQKSWLSHERAEPFMRILRPSNC